MRFTHYLPSNMGHKIIRQGDAIDQVPSVRVPPEQVFSALTNYNSTTDGETDPVDDTGGETGHIPPKPPTPPKP